MKRSIVLLASLFGVSLSSIAQVTVTPEVGYNLGKFYGFTYDPANNIQYTENYDWMWSPRAGIAFDIPLGKKGFSFEPGLYFNVRTSRVTTDIDAYKETVTARQNYVELPINLKYSWEVARYTGKFMVQLSPYVAYGVAGEVTRKKIQKLPTYYTTTESYELEWGSGMNQLKALDYGAYVGFGYQLQMGLQIRTIYGLSFANFSNLPNTVASPGSVFNLSVGYVLGRRLPGRFY